MNLATIFDRHPSESIALISRGKTTTYGVLGRQVAGFRSGLVELGLEPGDRIGIVCGNNWYFVVSYLAALGAGLVAVPLNPNSPAIELTHELVTVGARAVVVGPTARTVFESLDRSSVPLVEVFIGCGFVPNGGVDHDDLIEREPGPIVDREDDDVAVLIFTSGTAGSPKAARALAMVR